MTRIQMLGLAVAIATGMMAPMAATANPKTDRIVETTTDTAEIRMLFVREIRAHLVEVREARHARAERRAEARRAAEAAAAAAEAAATSAPTYTSSYSGEGSRLSDDQVASYLRGAGFPESAIQQMLYYSHRESGNCPTAVNGLSGCPSYEAAAQHVEAYHSACGLFQIYTCPGPDALDPARNAALAYSKYQSSGFSPWSL